MKKLKDILPLGISLIVVGIPGINCGDYILTKQMLKAGHSKEYIEERSKNGDILDKVFFYVGKCERKLVYSRYDKNQDKEK